MKTLLVVDASARVTRSVTREFTQRFRNQWSSANPDGRVLHRDLGLNPPPIIQESWITAAFSKNGDDEPNRIAALAWSDGMISDLEAADIVLFGIPVYNFGMPASVKAMFDQIIRVGRTFDFTGDETDPYRPLLASKPVIVIESAGDGAMFPGGPLHYLNFLEPHLETLFGFIGFRELEFIRIGYEEHKDERFEQSKAVAKDRIDVLAPALLPNIITNPADYEPAMSV